MIDLPENLLIQVKAILKKYLPEAEIWAFGSRVTGTAKVYSDLDLVVLGKEKLPQKQYYQLQEAFQESELPIKSRCPGLASYHPGIQEEYKKKL